MPRLVFKGIKIEELKLISSSLLEELSNVVKTDIDNFILEYPNNTYVFLGKEITIYPLVEVNWFKRDKDIEENVKNIIINKIRKIGYNEVEVYFVELKKESYYY